MYGESTRILFLHDQLSPQVALYCEPSLQLIDPAFSMCTNTNIAILCRVLVLYQICQTDTKDTSSKFVIGTANSVTWTLNSSDPNRFTVTYGDGDETYKNQVR